MIAQDEKTFEGGMFPQFGAIELPKGTYLDALNMYREEDGSMSKEYGTKLVSDNTAYTKVVGQYVFNSLLYYAVTKENGDSAIMSIDGNDTVVVVVSGGDLNICFNTNSKVRMEGKLNYKSEVVLYLAGEEVLLKKVNLTTSIVEDIFSEYTVPKIASVTEDFGGNVVTGVYQFYIRYASESLNTTSFFTPSNWYPIIEQDISEDKQWNADGSPQGSYTNKVLKVELEDLDSSFTYVEVGVATYLGEENVLTAYSLGKKRIGGDTLTVLFRGSDDFQEVLTLSELAVSNITYEKALTIAQKDSTLILANLEAKEPPVDWQTFLANKTKISWTEQSLWQDTGAEIHRDSVDSSVVFEQGTKDNFMAQDQSRVIVDSKDDNVIGGYADPQNCIKYKGYKRNEVYSFAVIPIGFDGSEGEAYHIPATPLDDNGDIIVPTGNMLEPALCANFEYTEDFGDLAGDKVAYHRFPGGRFFSAPSGDKVVWFALGISIEFPAGWKQYAQKLKIVRQSRVGYETQLAEAVCAPLIKNADNTACILPHSFGHIGVEKQSAFAEDEDDFYTAGASDNVFSMLPSRFNQRINQVFCPDYMQDTMKPEEVELAVMARDVGFRLGYMNTTESNTEASLNSLHIPTFDKESVGSYDPDFSTTTRFHEVKVTGTEKLDTRGVSGSQRPFDHRTEEEQFEVFNEQIFRLVNTKSFLMNTEFDLGAEYIPSPGASDIAVNTWFERNATGGRVRLTVDEITPSETSYFNYYMLIQLSRASTDYYGGVEDTEYVPVGDLDDDGILFGGDTFLSLYGFTNKFTGRSDVGAPGTYRLNVPWGTSTMLIPVQSYNNYNYRHQLDEIEETNSVPYYPKERFLETNDFNDIERAGEHGVNNTESVFGSSLLYNTQYSANQSIDVSFTKNFNIVDVYKFLSRAIYSNTQTEGDVSDAFSSFLADNYHDIPKDSGAITALNTVGNDLYISTERKLWKAFFNALVTQATSEGDVILGNGGAFSRPSVPMVDVNGGYIGTATQESTALTPSGMYVYDDNRLKLFYVGSNGLQEVTNPGMYNFLKEAKPTDVRLGYDYDFKRLMLSSPEVTLSYQPELNSFTGRHSYKFGYLTSLGDKTLLVNKDTQLVHKFDRGLTQKYFGLANIASFKTSSVVHPSLSKRFVGLDAVLSSKDLGTSKGLPFQFFDKFTANSDERHTGDNELIVIDGYNDNLESLGTIYVHKANNKFRMSIPADVVNDINNDIFDSSNWVTDASFTSDDRMFRPDMIDNHIVIEFKIDADKSAVGMSLSSLMINFVKNNT